MEKIGKYQIEELVGRGGFGRVYRAFDPTVNRTVAVKVLNVEGELDENQLLTRFHAEATTTGTLLHKNVVTVYEYGEQDGRPYLVMEYLQGRDLQHLIDNEVPLTLLEKVSLMRQVAEGLQYAHAKGIIHRDVKPGNIMLLNDGTVKLMDFGIARLLRDKRTRMTQQGRLLGSFSYMAPEQFQGRDADIQSDIFAFGVIYYELITGQHPFRGSKVGSDVALLIRNVTVLEPAPIRSIVPDCPAVLEEIVFKAINKDRQQRYQSFEDIQLDIAPLLAQLEADSADEKVKEGERLLAANDIETARTLAKEALKLVPGNRAADNLRRKIQQEIERRTIRERCEQLCASGRQELTAGNYTKAVDAFEVALHLDPENREAAELLGNAQSALQRIERANRLLELAQREVAADNLTNAAALSDKFFEEAMVLLSDLSIAYPAANKVHELMMATRKAQDERNRRMRLNSELDLARHQIHDENWEIAVQTLERLQVDYPEDNDIKALLSQSREGLKEQIKADDIARIVREAKSLVEGHEFGRAATLVSDGLRTYPDNTALVKSNSDIQRARQQHERQTAISQARQRAVELSAAEKFSDAIAELQKAIKTWDAQELTELVARLEADKKAHDRAKAYGDAQDRIQGHIGSRRFQEALNLARQTLKDFPNDAKLLKLISELEVRIAEQERQNRIDKAQKEIDELIARSQLEQALQSLQKATRDFPNVESFAQQIPAVEKAWRLKLRADAISSALSKAKQMTKAGDLDGAIALLEKTAGEQGNDESIKSALQELKEARSKKLRAAEIKAAVDQATDLYQKQRFDTALTLLREALKKFPGESQLISLNKQIEAAKTEQDRRAAVQKALEAAEELRSAGRFKEAIQKLEPVIAQYPQSPEIDAKIKQIRQELEKAEEIARALQEATRLGDQGKFGESIAILNRALSRFPGNTQLSDLLKNISKAKRKTEVDAVLNNAESSRKAGLLDYALGQVEAGLASFPDERSLLELKSSLRVDIGERSRRQNVEKTLIHAKGMIDSGNVDDAIKKLTTALNETQGDIELTKLLALARQAKNEQSDTVSLLLKKETPAAASKEKKEVPAPSKKAKVSKDTDRIEPAPSNRHQKGNQGRNIVIAAAAVVVLLIAGLAYHYLGGGGSSDSTVFRVSVEPAGARLQIGGQNCDQAPCSFNLKPGEYPLEATLEGHEPVKRTVTVGRGNSELKLSLTPLAATLIVTTNIDSGSVILDGKEVGSLDQGSFTIGALPDGDHDLSVKGADSTQADLKFRSQAGRIPSLIGPIQARDLEGLATATLNRKVEIVSDAKSKTVTIADRSVGAVGSKVVSADLPASGAQKLTFALSNRRWEFPLDTGNTPSLTIFLSEDRDVGALQVETGQAGVDVFINNRRYPQTEGQGTLRIPSLRPGKYDIYVTKSGYITPPTQHIAVARDGIQRVTFNLVSRLEADAKAKADADAAKAKADADAKAKADADAKAKADADARAKADADARAKADADARAKADADARAKADADARAKADADARAKADADARAKAAAQLASDRNAIRQLIDRYAAAFNDRDITTMTRIYKDAPRDAFKDRKMKLVWVLQPMADPVVNRDTATVRAKRKVTATNANPQKGEVPQTVDDVVTIELRSNAGPWEITKISTQ
jgi:eukaryotic-like serine/threonine-protein kinase